MLTHVRGNEHPLRQCIGGQITVEQGEVLGLGQAVYVCADGVVAY